jgi:hypothetical protein
MKSAFAEFFPLDKAAIDKLWRDGIIVVDTNILLRLYRYNSASADEIIELLKKLKNPLWIPHQVGWEYNKNRLDKIAEAERAYKAVISELQGAVTKVKKDLGDFSDYGLHPLISIEPAIKDNVDALNAEIEKIELQYKDNPAASHYASLHETLGELYNGKVGPAFTDEQFQACISDGTKLHEKKIGPGYADAEQKKKRGAPDQEVYGDLIIWRQMIEYAEEKKKPIIFVTEDSKDDWWLRRDGKTIGPRPDLRREFSEKTGQAIHFYRIQQFLDFARESLQITLSEATVKEVQKETERESNLVSDEVIQNIIDEDFGSKEPSYKSEIKNYLLAIGKIKSNNSNRSYNMLQNRESARKRDLAFALVEKDVWGSMLSSDRQKAIALHAKIQHGNNDPEEILRLRKDYAKASSDRARSRAQYEATLEKIALLGQKTQKLEEYPDRQDDD